MKRHLETKRLPIYIDLFIMLLFGSRLCHCYDRSFVLAGEQLLWSANFVAGLLAAVAAYAKKSTKHGLPKARRERFGVGLMSNVGI